MSGNRIREIASVLRNILDKIAARDIALSPASHFALFTINLTRGPRPETASDTTMRRLIVERSPLKVIFY
jgi:hypothetical protein